MENNGYEYYGYYNDGQAVYNAENTANTQYSDYQYSADVGAVMTEEKTEAEKQYADYLQAVLPQKRYAHPLLVLGLLIVCFPIGLFVMLCFTKWGAFPKTLITLFVLAVAVAVYEILVAKQVLLLPSLLDLLTELFTA